MLLVKKKNESSRLRSPITTGKNSTEGDGFHAKGERYLQYIEPLRGLVFHCYFYYTVLKSIKCRMGITSVSEL